MTKKVSDMDKIRIRSDYWRGKPVSEICKKYGISQSTVYHWVAPTALKGIASIEGQNIIIQKEISEMQRTFEKNKRIVTVLKESNCTAGSSLDDRLSEFLRLSPIYGTNTVLEALNISKGTYHNRIKCHRDPTYLDIRSGHIGTTNMCLLISLKKNTTHLTRSMVVQLIFIFLSSHVSF